MGFLPTLDHLCSWMKKTHSLYIFKYALGSTIAGQLPTLHVVRICLPIDNTSYYLLCFVWDALSPNCQPTWPHFLGLS